MRVGRSGGRRGFGGKGGEEVIGRSAVPNYLVSRVLLIIVIPSALLRVSVPICHLSPPQTGCVKVVAQSNVCKPCRKVVDGVVGGLGR